MMVDVSRPARLAVAISGSGRTLQSLIEVSRSGRLAGEIVGVISSRQSAGGLAYAVDAGIPAVVISPEDHQSTSDFSAAMFEQTATWNADLLILAGFIRKLLLPNHWTGRVLNIHPALLPESGAGGKGFYGERVHQAVLESGATISGATVHVVDDEYDHGPIVMRSEVPVLAGDVAHTLAARVFEAEKLLYPEAINRYLALHPELLE